MSTFNVKSYPRVAVYPTSWAGDQTFQEIYDDLTHYVSNVMKRNGFRPHEIPECLQNGCMVLWEMLVTQWNRWHMSLSSRIRDYMFMPLSRALLLPIAAKEHLGFSSSPILQRC